MIRSVQFGGWRLAVKSKKASVRRGLRVMVHSRRLLDVETLMARNNHVFQLSMNSARKKTANDRKSLLSVTFPPRVQDQNPSTPATPLPPSRLSASFLMTSALNFLKAASILALLSGSLVIVRLAEALPVRTPVSPPKKRPPALKKKYVAMSPRVVGLTRGAMSGIASVHVPQR